MSKGKNTTALISIETSKLLDKVKEKYGTNKKFAIEKALEEKYGHLLTDKEGE